MSLFAHGKRLERALDRHVAVAGLARHLLGLVEHAGERGGHMRLRGPASAHLRQLGKRSFRLLQSLLGVAPGAGNEPARQPFGVVEQHLQQMLGRDLRIAFAHGKRLRRLDEALEAV